MLCANFFVMCVFVCVCLFHEECLDYIKNAILFLIKLPKICLTFETFLLELIIIFILANKLVSDMSAKD